MRKELGYLLLGVALTVTTGPAWAQVSVEPGEVQPIPEIVRRVVASPRVAVAPDPSGPSLSADVLSRPCSVVGAAYNFPRQHARVLVRLGTTVFVQLGNDIEGVWYDGACGWLGAYLGLDVFNDDTLRWEGVGKAYRTAKACGPAHGSVDNMGVRFRAEEPGVYLLRARVISFALPLRRDLNLDRYLYGCRDVEVNYIFTLVRVIDTDPGPLDVDWLNAEQPVEGVDAITEDVPATFIDMLK